VPPPFACGGFASTVSRTSDSLLAAPRIDAASREIVQLYDKWFLQRLPTGERLDLAMSPQLEEFFRVLGVPE